jgi:hypothetical protein
MYRISGEILDVVYWYVYYTYSYSIVAWRDKMS